MIFLNVVSFVYLGLWWVYTAAWAFSLVVASGGLLSSCGTPTSVAAASLAVERGLWGMWASTVAVCGLRSCGLGVLDHRLSSRGAWA